ncbi:Mitochondrion protein [Pseudozyma hubeiensis]|nr:Mitochondrion protein [Pseudozyma hubeiensis]
MKPSTRMNVLLATAAFHELEQVAWAKAEETDYEHHDYPLHKVIGGEKLIENPTPFDLMASVIVVFAMTRSQLKKYDDLFLANHLFELGFRVDVHKSIIEVDRFDIKSYLIVQYDLDMEASDVDKFLEQSHEITSHRHFDSIWKQGDASREQDEEGVDCHTEPLQTHGCACLKHMRAWSQKLSLLWCPTCKPDPDQAKMEEED